MADRDKKALNSHDDPVVIDNGPFRLDLRGKKWTAHQTRSDGDVATREFTFFSQLLIGVIKSDDFAPPDVLRLTRTQTLTFHLEDKGVKATATLKWKQSGDPNEPYQNSLIASVTGIELTDDGSKRLKAKEAYKDFRVVSITQEKNLTPLWSRSTSDGTLFIVLVPETEPGDH